MEESERLISSHRSLIANRNIYKFMWITLCMLFVCTVAGKNVNLVLKVTNKCWIYWWMLTTGSLSMAINFESFQRWFQLHFSHIYTEINYHLPWNICAFCALFALGVWCNTTHTSCFNTCRSLNRLDPSPNLFNYNARSVFADSLFNGYK